MWLHLPLHLAQLKDSRTNFFEKPCSGEQTEISNWSCHCHITVKLNLQIDINLDKFARNWQRCTAAALGYAQIPPYLSAIASTSLHTLCFILPVELGSQMFLFEMLTFQSFFSDCEEEGRAVCYRMPNVCYLVRIDKGQLSNVFLFFYHSAW